MNDILIRTSGGFTWEEAEEIAKKADSQCVRKFWLPAEICKEEGKRFSVRVRRRKRP